MPPTANRVGGSRTADAGKEHGRKDGDRGQSAGQPSHQRIGKRDDSPGDAAGFHDYAGHHEQGHGHQVERVDARRHALNHHHQREIALDQHSRHGGCADGHGNGRIDGQQHKEHDNQQFSGHGTASPMPQSSLSSSAISKARVCRINTMPPKGMTL